MVTAPLGQNPRGQLSRGSSVAYRLLQSRRAHWLAAFLCVALLAAAVPPIRGALLRAAGNVLVCESSPIHSDVIVISVDSEGAGVLEASDLVHQGLAPGVESQKLLLDVLLHPLS